MFAFFFLNEMQIELIWIFQYIIMKNIVFQDLVKVLSEDNLAFEIPLYLRKNLELDLQAWPKKAPQGLLMQVIFFVF